MPTARWEPAGAFLGTRLRIDSVRWRIHALTEPPIVVTIEEIEYTSARLLLISVPEGLDAHSTKKGFVTRRWNDECLPMRPADVSRLDDERRGADWTSQGAQDQSRRTLGLASELDVLNGLRLLHVDGTLTRAGEILLCRTAASVSDEILVYQYRQTPGGEAVFARRRGTPMVTAFAEALEAITARIGITPANTSSGQ